MEDGGSEEEGERVERVCHRVSEEIDCMMWRELINYEFIDEVHMPNDGHRYLWKGGCGNPPWHPKFYSLRCRIRSESYYFLYRFPLIGAIMDEIRNTHFLHAKILPS
jgi:hypothetical protein